MHIGINASEYSLGLMENLFGYLSLCSFFQITIYKYTYVYNYYFFPSVLKLNRLSGFNFILLVVKILPPLLLCHIQCKPDILTGLIELSI